LKQKVAVQANKILDQNQFKTKMLAELSGMKQDPPDWADTIQIVIRRLMHLAGRKPSFPSIFALKPPDAPSLRRQSSAGLPPTNLAENVKVVGIKTAKSPFTGKADVDGRPADEDEVIIDVTSKSKHPYYVQFSPFYPHGGVPMPAVVAGKLKLKSHTVEGVWQGLKMFRGKEEGILLQRFQKSDGKPNDMKRNPQKGKDSGVCHYGGGGLGEIPGGIVRQFSDAEHTVSGMKGKANGMKQVATLGLDGESLDYVEARLKIQIPTYEWMLKNKMMPRVNELRALIKSGKKLRLLDFNVNGDAEDPKSSALSHAQLLRNYIFTGACWPTSEWRGLLAEKGAKGKRPKPASAADGAKPTKKPKKAAAAAAPAPAVAAPAPAIAASGHNIGAAFVPAAAAAANAAAPATTAAADAAAAAKPVLTDPNVPPKKKLGRPPVR